MPFIRFLTFTYYTKLVAVILLFSEIMPSCFYYIEKKLVYIVIIVLSSYQPSFYIKYIKSNMYLSCDIKSVSNAEYLYLMRLCSL